MDQEDFDLMPEAVKEEEDLDPDNPDDAFAILEKNYNKIIGEMEEDPAQSKYLDEYIKLFDYLYNIREQNISFAEENKKIAEVLSVTDEQVKQNSEIIEQDLNTIRKLTNEVEVSHRMIDTAHCREQTAQEMIDNLRRQIFNLEAEIELRNKMAIGDLEENPQVAKHRAGLEREKIKLMKEVTKLNEKLNNALTYQDELERRTSDADIQIDYIAGKMEETTAELDACKRQKLKLETVSNEQTNHLKERNAAIEVLTERLLKAEEDLAVKQNALKEHTQNATKCYKELEACNKRYSKLQDDYDTLNFNADQLRKENEIIRKNLQLKYDEHQSLVLEMAAGEKRKDSGARKINLFQKKMEELRSERNMLRKSIADLEKEIEMEKLDTEVKKRAIDDYKRERDIVNRNMKRLEETGKANIAKIKIHEQMRAKLQSDLDSYSALEQSQYRQILFLDKERLRIEDELVEKRRMVEEAMEDNRAQKRTIYEMHKDMVEKENRLRMQQNLIEGAVADKHALDLSLQNAQQENNNMHLTFKTQTFINEQLKEDIGAKERMLIKEKANFQKLAKDRDTLKVELNSANVEEKFLRNELAEEKEDRKRLRETLLNSDRAMRKLMKTVSTLVNERDVLSTQLVRRNDELFLLYEKVKLLQTTLHNGEAKYQQRIDDVRLLKIEIKRLRQEKQLFIASIKNMTDLKQEVFHLERDLTRERVKNKSLETEMSNPLNVHRWRKLEGSDPEVFALLQKITQLQKKILRQGSVLAERERQLKESQKLYLNLRKMLAKQPGPEVQQRVETLQEDLKASAKTLKTLQSELQMLEVQNKQCNIELAKAQRELGETKRHLLEEKKKRAKNMETLRVMRTTTLPALVAPSGSGAVRFTGGGFRMAVSALPTNLRNP